MKQQPKLISLSVEDASVINESLIAYAHAAFPMNGSECTQGSRQALLDIAFKILNSTSKPFKVKKRLVPLLSDAITWYLTEEDTGFDANNSTKECLYYLSLIKP